MFPSKPASLEDLKFALSLDPHNEIVKMKIDLYRNSNESDRLLPTTLIEERNSNPFLNPLKFKTLLGSSDKLKCFNLLLRLR